MRGRELALVASALTVISYELVGITRSPPARKSPITTFVHPRPGLRTKTETQKNERSPAASAPQATDAGTLRVCKGTEVRASVAFPGGTFKTLRVSTVAECCESCLANEERCTHWTLQGDDCNLKLGGNQLGAAVWDTGVQTPSNTTFSGWRDTVLGAVSAPAAAAPADTSTHQPKGGPSATKFHLVAFSDQMNRGLCCFLATAAHQQWVPEITASPQSIVDKQNKPLTLGGKMRKIAFWRSLTQSLPPDDIVWIVDAWDTLVQLGSQHAMSLYERFESHHGVRGVVIAGAETNCWPFMGRSFQPGSCTSVCCSWGVTKCDEMNPANISFLERKPTRYLYPNSGSIVTRVSSLGLLADYFISIMQSTPKSCLDDQALLGAGYRFQKEFKSPVTIRLDHDGLFSASTTDHKKGSGADFQLQAGVDVPLAMRKWQHAENDVVPTAIHINGDRTPMIRLLKDAVMSIAGEQGSFHWDGKQKDLVRVCGRNACDADVMSTPIDGCRMGGQVNCAIAQKPGGADSLMST